MTVYAVRWALVLSLTALAGCEERTPEQAKEKLGKLQVPLSDDSLIAKTKDPKSEDIAKMLVQAGANPNARQPNGMTALMSAAFNGQYDVAKTLIERGADVSATAKGYNALCLAVERENKDMVKLLLAHDADPQARPEGALSALERAQQRKLNDLVDILQRKN